MLDAEQSFSASMESSREMAQDLAAPLLTKSGDKDDEVGVVTSSESTFYQELKKVSFMAAPMVAVTVSQYLLQVVSLMMVGHFSELVSFSGVAIAISFAEVTGFSVLVCKLLILLLFNSSTFLIFGT